MKYKISIQSQSDFPFWIVWTDETIVTRNYIAAFRWQKDAEAALDRLNGTGTF